MKKRAAPKNIFPLGTLIAIALKDKEYSVGMILEHEIDSHLHHWYRVEWYFKHDIWQEKLTPNEISIYIKDYKKMRKALGI